jgi:hypothetical protein
MSMTARLQSGVAHIILWAMQGVQSGFQ